MPHEPETQEQIKFQEEGTTPNLNDSEFRFMAELKTLQSAGRRRFSA